MGIDPGLTRCGVGVVEGEPGRPLTLIDVVVIRTPHEDSLALRLTALERALELLVEAHQPEIVAVERVFSQHNLRTVMGTAQAGAVAVLAAGRRGIPLSLRTPSEVKAAVTGSGRADKAQVTTMVTRLLGLPDPVKPADAADALALAITEIWRGGAERRIRDALAGARQ
jgi:crossover junction endodeoxyribonuclease RuvC